MEEKRRVRMTKRIIKETLTEMLLNEPIDKVTVTNLCQRADVNRSTFYSHFETLNDVLNDIEKEFCENVSYISYARSKAQNRADFLRYMHYIEAHRDTMLVLLKNGRIIDQISQKSMSLFMTEQPLADAREQIKHGFYIRYACSGTYRFLEEWLKYPEAFTADEAADIVLEIAEGISKIERIHIQR